MNSANETQRINAFVDGELDLAAQLEMEARMRAEPALREEIDALRQLRSALRERAGYHAAPAALRARIAALTMPAPASAAAPDQAAPVVKRHAPAAFGAALWRWLGARPFAASFGVVAALALALNFAWLRSSQDQRLLDEVVASHVRSTLGQHLVDIASSDHHTVKPWLSSKLDFSPPVSALPIPGSVFLGGRVDYLDGRPVAALVYRQGPHVVNAFVWPGSTNERAVEFATRRGFQTAHWSRAGMTHWVISDVNPQEFATIVEAIQSAGGPATGR